MSVSGKIITFKNLTQSDKPFGIFGIFMLIMLISGIMGLIVYSELSLYIIPVFFCLPLIYLVIVHPKVWLYFIAVCSVLFFHGGGEDVGVIDVILGLLYLGSIVLWFIWKGLVLRQKIIFNWGDWAIVTFFTLLLINFFIAYFNDVEPLNWLREYLLISILLIYFPVRDILKHEKELNIFLFFFGILIIGAGCYQIYEYYQKLNNNIIYAYELQKSININQTLYTSSAIYGFILAFSQKKKIYEIIVMLFTALYVIFLISTFSRTFWIVLLGVIILIFFFLSARKKILLSIYLTVAGILLFLAVFLFMGNKSGLYMGMLFSRFESSGQGKRDISLIARFKEWEEVEKHIRDNPLGGNGLAKTFTFHFPINVMARHTHIIHNGYLWLLYRTGIPLTLLYLFFFVFYTVKAGVLIRLARNSIQRALLIASLGVLLSLYITNFTSAQFFYRDGIIIIAFTIAFIGIVEKMINNSKILPENVSGV